MDMKEWINKALPDVVARLEAGITSNFHVHSEEALNIAGRNAIYEVLDDILAALFPGAYSRERVGTEEINFFLGDLLRHVTFRLTKQISGVYRYHCPNRDCEECDCHERAQEACRALIEDLPNIRDALAQDIDAAYEGDPAAGSLDEIVLSYPCIEAIATYRVAHRLYELEVPIIPRIMSERAHSHTGIDIHPGAKIGPHFFIDHGTGVVIGETTNIGRNVKLYQGVTLGAVSPVDREGKRRDVQKRHPDIENDVIIYANATILGGKTKIGKGAVIGGNTWITESVPPGAVIYSNVRTGD
ncbi:MAG: serine acetyltransferase [Chitinivibrionales bacterium]|nr:serine acetyltransferase [Chitinivibrionales bacterium]MBD3357827.1 serine acetyltransferase [Chitinivibrionales bacterium]